MRSQSHGRSLCVPQVVILCGVIGMANHLMAGGIADSFSNNHPDVDLWAVRHTNIDGLRVVERNNRLEFEFSSQLGVEAVAGYIGNGWAIDPRQPLQFQMSVHFATPSVVQGVVSLVVGFSEEMEPAGTGPQDAVLLVYEQSQGTYVVGVVAINNGVSQVLFATEVAPIINATLFGSYNPTTNELTLTFAGPPVTIPNVLALPIPSQGTFFMAATSNANLTLSGSAMWVDNVSVSGSILEVSPLDVADCNGNGVPVEWLGDGFCDDGGLDSIFNGILIDNNCEELGFDGGDCSRPRSDLLWRHRNGQTFIWLMDGTDRVGQGSPGNANPAVWEFEGIGDFDGDGNADILWRHLTTGQVIVWFMNGTQRIGVGSAGSANPNVWEIAGIGDFDGLASTPTSTADILWRNTTTGQTIIWLMDGNRRIGAGSPGSVGAVWQIAGVGDFDGDGHSDILWYHTLSGQVFIWFIQGTQRVAQGSAGSANPNQWEIAGIANFDGLTSTLTPTDDILWRRNTGQTVIWLQNGVQRIGAGSPGNAGAVWQIEGTGDLDGDGNADILWRNQAASGQVFAWFIEGTDRVGQGPLGGISHDWQILGTGMFDAD